MYNIGKISKFIPSIFEKSHSVKLSISDYGFDGYSNSINLLREYYQQYACEFALEYYPFDTQVCHMVFALQVIFFVFALYSLALIFRDLLRSLLC